MTIPELTSSGVDILLHVLDSTKNYYKGSTVSTVTYYNLNTSNTGLKHVLDSCIWNACRSGIFETFAHSLMAGKKMKKIIIGFDRCFISVCFVLFLFFVFLSNKDLKSIYN